LADSGTYNGASTSSPRRGEYANYFTVGFNEAEFVIDFAQFYAGQPDPQDHLRIVTSPAYARELLHVLDDALRKFEAAFPAAPPHRTPSAGPGGARP
jgi:hypothetical protein